MDFKELVKKRKEYGIKQKTMHKLVGFSEIWIRSCESGKYNASERLRSKYEKVLKEYELFLERVKKIK